MKIAYFEKNLLTHLGNAARSNFEILGLSNTEIRQVRTSAGMASFIRVVNDEIFDPSKCTKVMTAGEANAKIAELFTPEYFISNETIFNASLNAKIASGGIDIDTLNESGTMSDQYKWFHDHGVKGIKATVSPAPFTEV